MMEELQKLSRECGFSGSANDFPTYLEPNEELFIKWINSELTECMKFSGETKIKFDKMMKQESNYMVDESSKQNWRKECELRREISNLKEDISSKQSHLQMLNNVHSSLSSEYQKSLIEQEKLTKCLVNCQHEYTRINEDIKLLNAEMNEALSKLEGAVVSVLNVYQTGSKTHKATPTFFSDCNQHNYHQSESTFLKVLTDYAKKHFSPGINEVVDDLSSKEDSISDTSAGHDLAYGDHKKELERLERILPLCKFQCINGRVGLAYHESIIKRIEQELEYLKRGQIKHENELKGVLPFIESSVTDHRERIQHCVDHQLTPLLHDHAVLQVTMAVHSDQDTRLARQASFTAVQDEIIQHLESQKIRYEVLSMLLEADYFKHRNSYQLLQATRGQLEKWHQNNVTRLGDIENITEQSATRSDTLLDVLPPLRERDLVSLKEDKLLLKQHKLIDKGLSQYNNLCGRVYNKAGSPILVLRPVVYTQLVNNLEGVLGTLEAKIKELLKEHTQKRKALQCNPLLQTERDIFSHFFLNPSNLSQLISDLTARIDSAQLLSSDTLQQ